MGGMTQTSTAARTSPQAPQVSAKTTVRSAASRSSTSAVMNRTKKQKLQFQTERIVADLVIDAAPSVDQASVPKMASTPSPPGLHRRRGGSSPPADDAVASQDHAQTSQSSAALVPDSPTAVTPPRHEEKAIPAAHSSPTSVTLWQRAEHFLDSFTPAQAAAAIQMFHSNMEQQVNGWNESWSKAHNPNPATGAVERNEPEATQQTSDCDSAESDAHSLLGISRLCGPHEGLVTSVQHHLPWLVPTSAEGPTTTSPPSPPSPAMTRRSQRHALKQLIVTSRTHEDIEVTPGHRVKVRLPPTNPTTIVVSSSGAMLDTSGATTSDQAVAALLSTEADQEDSSRYCQVHQAVPAAPSFGASKVLSTAGATTGALASESSKANVTPPPATTAPKEATTTTATATKSTDVPIASLTVRPEEAAALERSISELTMRSSYAATDGALQKIPENRRMAYYAVGKHHRNAGRGGNRRCYFTGKLILGGAPFYAGSVLQGLRTLVVFCLPSAIGLPDKDTMLRHKASLSSTSSSLNGSLRGLRLLKASTNGSGSKTSHLSQYTNTSYSLGANHHPMDGNTIRSNGLLSASSRNNSKSSLGGGSAWAHNKRISSGGTSTAGYSHASKSMSRLSSLDDLSLSVEGDLDPNWSMDRDFLLKVLPPANKLLLHQMETLYPDQFETLPVQVRDASHWKLYVKFCFFSGLPISDGEMHYKVRDDIAEQVYGEEIVLSHDVMEASAGASAEILTLPNRTVIRYLRKHYSQQCSKLDDRVFQRASWERMAPEV